tara:strand:+ start:3203 stop:3616 length:414 start_codon:yes stop_codon:yes gene_type:complete
MEKYVLYNSVTGNIESIERITEAKAHKLCKLNATQNMSCILESEINGSVSCNRTQELVLSTTPISVRKLPQYIITADVLAKQKRNTLLTACDWTVGVDSPLSDAKKGEWQTYRQALRDFDYASVTQDFGIVWPTPPQ